MNCYYCRLLRFTALLLLASAGLDRATSSNANNHGSSRIEAEAEVSRSVVEAAEGSRRVSAEASRRVLHEPLFPIVNSPVPAPTPVPGFQSPPRIPFTNQPFFPLSPSSPPPPAEPSSDTSIPVNIGNLNPPKQGNNNKSRSRNIVIAIIVSLCAIGALGALLFFLHRRSVKDPWAPNGIFTDETPLTGGSGNSRVFHLHSPVTKLAANGGSECLYLGTMDRFVNTTTSNVDRDRDTHTMNADTHTHKQNGIANAHEKDDDDDSKDDGNALNSSKYGVPSVNGAVERFHRQSPEVHPLPPLSRRRPRPGVCTDDSSDEESFYSPRCASTSSSRSNSDSPRISVCKRLFSPSPPPLQQPSIVSLKSDSTHSYPSSATSSVPSSPSPSNSPPSPSPPITPTVQPPPIASHLRSHSSSPSHLHSHSHSSPRHYPNSESQPTVAPPPFSHQLKTPPPPPPPPPPPLFHHTHSVISASARHKPDQQSSPSIRAKEKSNPLLTPASKSSTSESPLLAQKLNRVSPTSSTMKEKSVSPSPPSRRSSHSPLPPLPTRPPPPFFSSSRTGKSSNCPPPPPPPPTQNKPSPPETLPSLPSRPPFRPHSALYSTRTGQSLQPLASTSEQSLPENAAEQLNGASTDGTPRPKLKPLHWDKVRASPDRAMVWDQLKSGSFKLNEEVFETLFVYNTPTPVKAEATKRSVVTPPSAQSQRILETKKSQNIAILLRALSMTKEEVCDALLEGTNDSLSTELLETLVKMAPSKEEEIRLKEYNGDTSKLGPAERFLKAILDIPFAFKRFDAMLYRASFKEEINYIKKSFETLEAACEELRSSRLFFKLLEAVLKTGNRMNVGTIRGDAQAFKLDTLLKLVDVKGTDGKTTLLHFVVQEIIKAEGARIASTGEQPLTNSTSGIINDKLHALGTEVKSQKDKEEDYRKLGLQVVAGLSIEMGNVKKAAGIDSDVLSNSVSKLATGLGKLREILQVDVTRQTKDGKVDGSSKQGNFYRSMESFLRQAEEDIQQIQDEEKRAFSHVKEITEYFHGDAGKEEAHPLRFFVIVRDFLSVLDQVCREIGRLQTRNFQSSVRTPPVVVHAFSRPLPRGFYERRPDSSDDESLSP